MKHEKFLSKAFKLVHRDIRGELYNERGDIDGKKIGIIVKSLEEITNSNDRFYILNFFKNYNKEGDYSNLVLKDDLTFKDFSYGGFDDAYIISQEFGVPYTALEQMDDYDREFCLEEGYNENYSGCFIVYTEKDAQEVLDEMFRDSLYSLEDTIAHYGFDLVLRYLYISDTDKRMLVNDMIENEMSNLDEDEIVERLGDFKVGENLTLIEKYDDLKEEIGEKEYEGESVGELYDELENTFLDIEYELRNQLQKYYTVYLDRDLTDFLWEFGYITKNTRGEFEVEGNLPNFIIFDEDRFVKRENWYEAEMLSPYEVVYETYLLGQWFYIVKIEE